MATNKTEKREWFDLLFRAAVALATRRNIPIATPPPPSPLQFHFIFSCARRFSETWVAARQALEQSERNIQSKWKLLTKSIVLRNLLLDYSWYPIAMLFHSIHFHFRFDISVLLIARQSATTQYTLFTFVWFHCAQRTLSDSLCTATHTHTQRVNSTESKGIPFISNVSHCHRFYIILLILFIMCASHSIFIHFILFRNEACKSASIVVIEVDARKPFNILSMRTLSVTPKQLLIAVAQCTCCK